MDEGLFARVKAVYENMDGLDREQQMVTKKLYDRFVRNGVGLEGEAKTPASPSSARSSARTCWRRTTPSATPSA